MSIIEALHELRTYGGAIRSPGLNDREILYFAAHDGALVAAVEAALARHRELRADCDAFLRLEETAQLAQAQAGYVNFYPDDVINPYLPAAAQGPWVVILKGAVLHVNGGYGMLGLGHDEPSILRAQGAPQVMANVMTPSSAQWRFSQVMQPLLGRHRDGSPYSRLFCLNSGSEAASLACRIADAQARLLTETGGRYAGRRIKRLAVKGAFHGRTDRPALYSGSSRGVYREFLASYRDENSLITVPPYGCRSIGSGLRPGRTRRLVYRGHAAGAGDGRRRPRPRGDAGFLPRRPCFD